MCVIEWALIIVIVLVIIVILHAPQERASNPPLNYIPPYWQKQLDHIREYEHLTGSMPLSSSNKEYCPYRALIGKWRTSPDARIPQIVQEYEFSTMPDGKTILLRMRHIMLNDERTAYNRGECIMRDFTCIPGFAGDITITANCVDDVLPGTLVDGVPRKFHVLMNSQETVLVDAASEMRFTKV